MERRVEVVFELLAYPEFYRFPIAAIDAPELSHNIDVLEGLTHILLKAEIQRGCQMATVKDQITRRAHVGLTLAEQLLEALIYVLVLESGGRSTANDAICGEGLRRSTVCKKRHHQVGIALEISLLTQFNGIN